jgi:hypothetical protein
MGQPYICSAGHVNMKANKHMDFITVFGTVSEWSNADSPDPQAPPQGVLRSRQARV